MGIVNNIYKTKPLHFISQGKQCNKKMVYPYIAIISCIRSSELNILNSKPLLIEVYIDYTAFIINYNYPVVL